MAYEEEARVIIGEVSAVVSKKHTFNDLRELEKKISTRLSDFISEECLTCEHNPNRITEPLEPLFTKEELD